MMNKGPAASLEGLRADVGGFGAAAALAGLAHLPRRHHPAGSRCRFRPPPMKASPGSGCSAASSPTQRRRRPPCCAATARPSCVASVESLKSEILEACLASWLRPLSAGPDSPELARTLGEARGPSTAQLTACWPGWRPAGGPRWAARLLRLACRFLAARFRAIDEGEGESGGAAAGRLLARPLLGGVGGLLTAAVNTGLTHLLPPQEAACGPLRQLLLHSLVVPTGCADLPWRAAAQLPSCCPLRPPELGDRPAVAQAAPPRDAASAAASLAVCAGTALKILTARLDVSKAADNDEGSMSQLFSSASRRQAENKVFPATSGTLWGNRACGLSAEALLWATFPALKLPPAAMPPSGIDHLRTSSFVGTEKVIDRKGKAYTPCILFKYLAWYSDVDRSRQQQPPASKSAVSRQRVVKRRLQAVSGLYKDLLRPQGYRTACSRCAAPTSNPRPAAGQCGGLATRRGWLQARKLERVLSDVADLLPRLFSSGGQLGNATGPPLSSEAKDEQPRQPCAPPPPPRCRAPEPADAESSKPCHDLEAATHQLALLLTERYRPTWCHGCFRGPLLPADCSSGCQPRSPASSRPKPPPPPRLLSLLVRWPARAGLGRGPTLGDDEMLAKSSARVLADNRQNSWQPAGLRVPAGAAAC
uniref:HECT domain-containing protein n=1 Tax=Macrostomum lignano TaxID=282301 RepID=A0A1I8F614_9PLAT